MKAALLALGLALFPALAQSLDPLPAWAQAAAREALAEPVPADADDWVLLDRTELAYGGKGEVWRHRFRLVRILTEQGLGEGHFALWGLGGRATVVKKLKGWNLRPNGELVKLDSENVVSVEGMVDQTVTTRTITAAFMTRVAKGSYVAFEAQEVETGPNGPAEVFYPLEASPVRRLEVVLGKREGWFQDFRNVELRLDARHLTPWIQGSNLESGKGFSASNLPALPKGKDEGAVPGRRNLLPVLLVRFLDPELKAVPTWADWDEVATWMAGSFAEKARPSASPVVWDADPAKALASLGSWMGHHLRYKQVYLTPARGWLPEAAPEVLRRAYGDCKDLTSVLLAEAGGLGFPGAPVLAAMEDGLIEADEPPSPRFDHVIAALKLGRSLGFPAEVVVPEGRYLLVDPTDPWTPLGWLPSSHRSRSVMLCLPGKARWVAIPDAAILGGSLKVELDGTVALGGTLTARVRIAQAGSGLRRLTAEATPNALRDYLAAHFNVVPSAGTLELVGHSDPWDLATPFTVDVRLTNPDGLRGGRLDLPFLPLAPGVVQKRGVPRSCPVQAQRGPALAYRAVLNLPGPWHPRQPESALHTVRRDLTWSAQAKPSGEGTQLTLSLDQNEQDAAYAFATREQGVADFKKDRAAFLEFMDGACRLTPSR